MNRRLKRAITFRLISGLVIVTPVIASIMMAIIGVTYWNWDGRAALSVLAGLILSGSLLAIFIALINEHENDISEWINEPEPEKRSPKAGAWKEGEK